MMIESKSLAWKTSLSVKVRLVDGEFEFAFGGKMQVGQHQFTISTESSANAHNLRATWDKPGDDDIFNIQDLINALEIEDAIQIPDELDFGLKGLSFEYNTQNYSLELTAETSHYGKAFFTTQIENGTRVYVFGVGFSGDLRVREFPLIGEKFQDDVITFKRLMFVVASADIEEFNIPKSSSLLANSAEVLMLAEFLSASEAVTITRGISILAEVELGGTVRIPFTLPLYTPDNRALTLTEQPGLSQKVWWIDVQKTLSVFQFKRIGFQFSSDPDKNETRLGLLLDAGVKISGFQLDFYGFSLGFNLQKLLEDLPELGLEGIYAALNTGSVDLRGGLLRTQNSGESDPWIYNGVVVIKISGYGIAGLGSYTTDDRGKNPSLFVFGFLGVPFGDPAFYVTGLAAGFGYNREIEIPTIDELHKFALVAVARGGELDLREMNHEFPMAYGNVWLAAGIEFSSYEIVSAYLLAVLSIGTQFELSIIGIASVQLPKSAPRDKKLINIELALIATLDFLSGRVSFSGALTPNSYIFVKEAKLEGGFTLSTWLYKTHAGDFVLSLGGYHPQFSVPAHYPKLKALGFNWKFSDRVTIKGNRYFALTPSCIMFGGLIEAVFQFDKFKAWFKVQADFLMAWLPLKYGVSILATVGVSYQLTILGITNTISVEVGTSLRLKGPKFQGTVTINLKFISLEAQFGEEEEAPTQIQWRDFQNAFLAGNTSDNELTLEAAASFIDRAVREDPKPLPICQVSIADGLVEEIRKEEDRNPGNTALSKLLGWIVAPGSLVLVAHSRIPIKRVYFNGQEENHTGNQDFGVGFLTDGGNEIGVQPSDFKSCFKIEIRDAQNQYVKFEVQSIKGNVPRSMWAAGEPQMAGGEASQIKDVLTGLQLCVKLEKPLGTPIPWKNLVIYLPPVNLDPEELRQDHYKVELEDPLREMENTIGQPEVSKARETLVKALSEHSFPVTSENIRVDRFKAGQHDLAAQIALVGMLEGEPT